MKWHIMKMGEDTVEEVKNMIVVIDWFCLVNQRYLTNLFCQELDCKVSLSLDGWTSSNQHEFLAIVMHYITNDWQLGECLNYIEILD